MRIWALFFCCMLFSTTVSPQDNSPYAVKRSYSALDRKEYAAQVMLAAVVYKRDHKLKMGDTTVEAVGPDSTVLFIEDYKSERFNWPILTYKNDAIREELIRRGFKRIIFEWSGDEICIYNLETDTIHFENLVDVNYKYGSTNAKRYI